MELEPDNSLLQQNYEQAKNLLQDFMTHMMNELTVPLPQYPQWSEPEPQVQPAPPAADHED
jgi:hypothetical protein